MEQLSLEDFYTLAEGQDLECKAAQGRDGNGELPKDFWPTYSAMANTLGGEIWLGVVEKNNQFTPVGINNVEKIKKDLFNNINNAQKVSCNLLTDSNFVIVNIDGINIIKIIIPKADRHQKPVYLSNNIFQETYIRRNEGDCKASTESIKRMLVEQVEDSRDERFLNGFSVNDFDMSTVSAYRNRFSAVKIGHPWIDLPLEQFLVKIGALGIDRANDTIKVRLAGLLMFGQSEIIIDEVPNFMLDYQERPEAKTEKRWIDRVSVDGTWSGNIYDFFRKVYPKLVKDLQVPFSVNDGQRRDDTPVHVAIREALVNSLIHADYSGRMSILVVKRPDLFGFRNPGLMRVPLELALAGGNSDCRNRRLQTMFQLGSVEN